MLHDTNGEKFIYCLLLTAPQKNELLDTKCSLSLLDGIRDADSESEVGFALSRQNFELFAFFKICIK